MVSVQENFVGRVHHKVPTPLQASDQAQKFSVPYRVVPLSIREGLGMIPHCARPSIIVSLHQYCPNHIAGGIGVELILFHWVWVPEDGSLSDH